MEFSQESLRHTGEGKFTLRFGNFPLSEPHTRHRLWSAAEAIQILHYNISTAIVKFVTHSILSFHNGSIPSSTACRLRPRTLLHAPSFRPKALLLIRRTDPFPLRHRPYDHRPPSWRNRRRNWPYRGLGCRTGEGGCAK